MLALQSIDEALTAGLSLVSSNDGVRRRRRYGESAGAMIRAD
jgi:hypothetical protein